MKKVYFPKQAIDELPLVERYAFELREVKKDEKPIKVSFAISDDTAELHIALTREQAARVAKSILTQLAK